MIVNYNVSLSAVLLLGFLAVLTKVASADHTEACQNYATCLQALEEKQRECRDTPAARRRDRATSDEADEDDEKCSKKRNHGIHAQITGLHLRKTEETRDCVRNMLESASLIGTADAQKKCQNLYLKLMRKIEGKNGRKNRKTRGGKKQRKQSQKKDDVKCKKERRMLHRKCHKLANCCSIAETCNDKTASFLSQISELKTTLRLNRAQCRNGQD